MFNQSLRRALVAGVALTAGLVALSPVSSVAAEATSELGGVTGFERDGDSYTFESGEAALRVTFEDADMVRVRLAPNGEFDDPANDDPTEPGAPDADIVVKRDYPGGRSEVKESGAAYVISTAKAVLTVTKQPITLRLTDPAGKVLMAEASPLTWDDQGTAQHLERGAEEQFFGGGMQNGRFSHRGETIKISRDFNWNDGGNPNAVPFYLSSRGYGVLRNTFAAGSYDFGAPTTTTHDEQRFDAYYFVGDAERVIDSYTELTGRPVAVPMYALEVGDADCYLHNANRGERETLRDSTAIAEGYAEHDLPLGWMLVNDGYGCGYEDLAETGDMLNDHGAELGLWTEDDLTEQETEVKAGVRVRKTDVAWVGPGYRFALDACEQARDGIETNSADRSTVLTVEGWAGTQRCAAVWSGDQSGSWDYIRWQIPTYAGSTMSGQHLATGDVDGIFGGSAETYVRDMQWKMFLPMTYLMSGWAASDKQPWRYGEPYTSINRKYLSLHERLLPYFYTHTMRANRNGVGAVKPLYLNYPEDPKTWGDEVKYEFLAGDDFLVAPVYEDATTRDGIYLPEGTWVDYWSGRVHQGPTTIDGYKAPLDTLPLFVRAGAVVPQFPEGTLDWQQGKKSGRLDLDIYPQGSSSFVNYEDDGRSQAHASGESATQEFEVDAPEQGRGRVVVRLGEVDGSYAGKPASRAYGLSVHADAEPGSVELGGDELPQRASKEELEGAATGWFHDSTTGITSVKTGKLPTSSAAVVALNGSSAVGGAHPGDRDVSLDAATSAIAVAGEAGEVSATFTNDTGSRVKLQSITATAPEGWDVRPGAAVSGSLAPGASRTATFSVTPPADASPGRVKIDTTATYVAHDRTYAVTDSATTTLAHPDLASAFNNVGVTRAEDPGPGDIDGGGSSFLADKLAEKGVTPGATVSANGFDFTWPDSEPGTQDNVASGGETIRINGRGNALAFLGTGTSLSASAKATVHYTDGTSGTGTLGFPNWCCAATDSYGAEVAVTTLGKNTPNGPAYPTVSYRLFTKTLRTDPAKEIAAVTLPANAAVHVFAMTVGDEEVVPPALADGQYSLGNVASGLALDAAGATTEGQLTTSAVGAAASQKWVVTRNEDDGSYQLKNAGTGLCADVAYSSTTSGDPVVEYTCTGTPNQRWVIAADGAALKIAAKHSGLSLTAGAEGLVIQQTDSATGSQRWRATPN
ncbi:NPCBM-associated, NEW3 domain of alpha-galactosidase [Nocardioides sp. YR527]|nr:NPCBM-associated, NEW3 domain of alpha-galactosidase [Nocardioides sp. YR527]